jgi:hypothetical protein
MMEQVLLVLKAKVDCGVCAEDCPFLTVTLPGGYACRLFGPLGMEMEYGPESVQLLGGAYPKRHNNCLSAESEGDV